MSTEYKIILNKYSLIYDYRYIGNLNIIVKAIYASINRASRTIYYDCAAFRDVCLRYLQYILILLYCGIMVNVR